MHIKSAISVVALLFAVAQSRYAGAGSQGLQCNGVQFFPQCSLDQFLNNVAQCQKNLFHGYPYRNTGQCMNNLDQYFACMQVHSARCMSSNCPSYVTSFDGVQQFMPIFNRFQNVNSLEALYRAIDETINEIINRYGIQAPVEMQRLRQKSVKYYPIPLPGHEGLTVHQYLTEMICPVPGQMPRSFQRLLPSIEMSLKLMDLTGLIDTSNILPFCDADVLAYLVNNMIQHMQGFYRSATRSEYCKNQRSFANVVDNVVHKKCDYNQLSGASRLIGIPSSVIDMLGNFAQIFVDVSGCQDDQIRSSSYQQQQSRFSSNFNNFRNPFQNIFQRFYRRY